MSIPLYAGIGAGIGAVCGGAAGFFIQKKKKTVPPPPSPAAAAANKKNELFGIPVVYFLQSSEFYTMLVRFENYLQFATERESFKDVVENIDNFLGMEALLHGHNPVSKAALPTLADVARRKTLQILTNLIAFSQEQRPSATKQEAMNTIKEEINQAMTAIVKDMHRALAALPIPISKTQ